MNQEEMKKLAIGCGATEHKTESSNAHARINHFFEITDAELAAYTAAVEARERERCRLIADEHPHYYGNAISMLIGS